MKHISLSRRTRRGLLAAAALFLAAAAAAPFVSADRFRPALQRDLESLTGRDVKLLGEVRFRLLPRPGFTIENPSGGSAVVVGELPAAGVEPFAYVERMDVSVSVLALLLGRVEVKRISLQTPSINLARLPKGGWNVQSLLERAFSGPSRQSRPLPEILVADGRLNFKSGDTKSVFYLDATELTLEADVTDPARFGIRIEGEPARTDRPNRAFGLLSGRGMLTLASAGRESRLDFSLAVERTPISELLALAFGRGAGLGGMVAARSHVSGPLSNLEIKGRIQLDDIDRLRWVLPGSSTRALEYHGRLDLVRQEIDLSTPMRQDLPVSARVKARSLAGRPRWAAITTLRQVPLASVLSLMSELGAGPPAGWRADGRLSGALGLSSDRPPEGRFEIAEGAVSLPDLAPIEFDAAGLVVDGANVRLLPTRFRLGEQSSFQLEAHVDRTGPGAGRTLLRLQAPPPPGRGRPPAPGLALAHLHSLSKLVGAAPLPIPLDAPQGRLAGSLAFTRQGDEPPQWTGQFRLTDTRHRIDGLAQPVELASASVQLRGQAVLLRGATGRAGPVRFSADVAVDPSARPPVRLSLDVPETSLSDLEFVLRPSLDRRSGLLARLRESAPRPAWLLSRRVEADCKIGALKTGGPVIEGVAGRASWIGGQIVATGFSGAIGDGSAKTSFAVNLLGGAPEYRGHVSLSGVNWQEGSLDVQGDFTASGLGPQVLAGLRMTGTFRARELTIGPNRDWRSLAGSFTYGAPTPGRLLLTELSASAAGDTYRGQGAASSDGRVVIDLTGSPKQYRLTGRLSGLHLHLTQAAPR